MKPAAIAAVAGLAAAVFTAQIHAQVAAQESVEVETFAIEGLTVSLYLHPFLSEDELTILRQIATIPEVLTTFVGDLSGHAAIAISPADGFLTGGVPAASATAMTQFPDAESARDAVLAACDAASADNVACVIVLAVAPG